jgi:hypothetical protein
MGDMLCGYLEGSDPIKANREFAASKLPFDLWFKGQLKGLFPPQVDFNQPLPAVMEIFDSVAVMSRVSK